MVWLATVCRVVGDKAKEFSSGGRVAEDAGEVVGEGKGGGVTGKGASGEVLIVVRAWPGPSLGRARAPQPRASTNTAVETLF